MKKTHIFRFEAILRIAAIRRIAGIIALAALIGLGAASCNNDPGGDPDPVVNPFAGTTWEATVDGDTMLITFTATTWTAGDGDDDMSGGSYTYSGNTATLTVEGGTGTTTAVISGNSLTVDFYGQVVTFTRKNVPALSGNITISPDQNVTTGTTLSAHYSGTENVTYRWKVGTTNLGTEQMQRANVDGSYTVTVSASGYASKTSAPVTVGKGTPNEDDYNFDNLIQAVGNVTAVTETLSHDGYGSSGEVTFYYEGISPTTYAKTTDVPTAEGSYAVTFDVAEAEGWNPATGLSAGTLTIIDIGNIPNPFTDIDEFKDFLDTLPANSAGIAYHFVLNINDLGGSAGTAGSLGNALSAYNYSSIKYVSLDLSGSTFDTIPANAFAERALTSVTIPDTVTTIGNSAFTHCRYLTSVTIPDGVTSIGDNAFDGCSLTSVTIPDSVTSIGSGAFRNCSGLTSVTIPDSVTTIGNSAFSGCTGLTSVTIPDSVTSIGTYAFGNCTSLTSVTIPSSVTSIGDSAFNYCSSLTSVTIPSSVTSIGQGAFNRCTGLTSVTIPDSVTSIGRQAFYGCTGLTSVTVGTNNQHYASSENIVYSKDRKTLIFAAGGISGSVTIPDGVEDIGEEAFAECADLASVDIPDSVTSIGSGAFRNCSGLTSVTIPSSVTSIGDWAFQDCTSLTSVTIRATTPPTPSSGSSYGNWFDYTNDYPIYVPAGSVDAYKAAESWSQYADRIQAIQ